MRIEPAVIKSNKGRNVILRSIEIDDAGTLIEFLKRTADESIFLSRSAEEVSNAVEVEEMIIGDVLESPYSFMIVAEAYGEMIAECSINPVSLVKKSKHRAITGIAVRKDYWHQSIGRQIMEYAIAYTKEIGYEQLELIVLENNTHAIAMYESLGFQIVGTTPDAVKYDDGTYVAELRMIKRL